RVRTRNKSGDEPAVTAPIVQQRRSLPRVTGYDFSDENCVITGVVCVVHTAVEPSQCVFQHRRAGCFRTKCETVEFLVDLPGCEATGNAFVRAVEHVDGEKSCCADALVRIRVARDTHENEWRI